MNNAVIYPRSPRETMAGWAYLPRFVDKVRLHLAGKLHADYQENFAYKGFDAKWLAAAGLNAHQRADPGADPDGAGALALASH